MSLLWLLSFLTLGTSSDLWSQEIEDPEKIELQEDHFQNYFYEALKHKGIENYDRAVYALQQSLEFNDHEPTVYFELGKNYLSLRQYDQAKIHFEKAKSLDPSNRWFWGGLYDVAYAQRDFQEAEKYLRKLVEFKATYKDELVALFMTTQQYEKALVLIDEITATSGKSETLERYRQQINSVHKYEGLEEKKLLEAIEKDPKSETSYIALIYLYSEKSDDAKAIEIAKLFKKNIPTSDWADVSLFKFYLNEAQAPLAISSMKTVLRSAQIEMPIKHRIFNEFLIFASNNTKYQSELEKVVEYMDDQSTLPVALEVGKFYQNRQDWNNAFRYYQKHWNSEKKEWEPSLLYLTAAEKIGDWKVIQEVVEHMLDLFPFQPELYYYSGLILQQQNKSKQAITMLNDGLDYIVDDKDLKAKFHTLLSEVYKYLGDSKNQLIHQNKAKEK